MKEECEICRFKITSLDNENLLRNYYCKFCFNFVVCMDCLEKPHKQIIKIHDENFHLSSDLV